VARDDRIPELGASPQFMEAVFALPPGGISEPLPVARGVALVVAGETLPPANRALDEVKDRVRSDVLNARARAAARSAAGAALARHRTLEDAAKALGVEVRSGIDATPKQTLAGTGGTSPELDVALFSATAAAGDVGVAPVPAGAVIYRVQQVERFDPATFAARRGEIRDEILGQRRSAYVQAMTEKLRGKHQIEMNSALVEQVGR
jgi:hypothetical protein